MRWKVNYSWEKWRVISAISETFHPDTFRDQSRSETRRV